jgi:hypothetical protein
MSLVTIKGSDVQWPDVAVLATLEWLEDLLLHNLNGFFTVVDLACNDKPANTLLTEQAIRLGLLQSDGTVQTTRRDLTRLMVLHADDPMMMRLARWDELEVTPVGEASGRAAEGQ